MPETPEQGPNVALHLAHLRLMSNYHIRRSTVTVEYFLHLQWRYVGE
jgi:hypothetical protein